MGLEIRTATSVRTFTDKITDEGMAPVLARAVTEDDRAWVRSLLERQWGSTTIIARGVSYDAVELPALIADRDGERVGLATFRIRGGECQLISLDATVGGVGVGTMLLNGVTAAAHDAGCRRLCVITSNDNTAALRFYQRRGWDLVTIHRDAITRAREIKPDIPLTGNDDIPVRHEIELELELASNDRS